MLYLKNQLLFLLLVFLLGNLWPPTLPVIRNYLIISIQNIANQIVLDIEDTLLFNSKSISSTIVSTFFSYLQTQSYHIESI